MDYTLDSIDHNSPIEIDPYFFENGSFDLTSLSHVELNAQEAKQFYRFLVETHWGEVFLRDLQSNSEDDIGPFLSTWLEMPQFYDLLAEYEKINAGTFAGKFIGWDDRNVCNCVWFNFRPAKEITADYIVKSATLEADYTPLLTALALHQQEGPPSDGQYENHKAVKSLCDWWNDNAPEGLRSAGAFRLYVLDDGMFMSQDESPDLSPLHMLSYPASAVFSVPGGAVIAAVFIRGRSYNTLDATHGVIIHAVDGSQDSWVGVLDLEEVDEAYYSYHALSNVGYAANL